ncbi:MAG TPA: DUF2069 domain-containing protein [Arenimonas sp.]|uniref:DUF2069 domain-containing protein n=1 Tax=Arenimonas sp. TaxID=1872635 RepID=UPI002D7EF919|nr:DUF2069 domain-containing protein [Arenimonas sp.]HEU0152844.1 DUF2069 domain-containing protein [Arenimonas sp.]
MSPMAWLARVSIWALFALLVAWHGVLAPPQQAPWAMVAFFALPLLPALLLSLPGHRKAGFWGALAALLYFSHGVMVAWSTPELRLLGLLEAGVSALLVVAASWDGMRARFAKRTPPPAV